jgi:hypothetical protein
MRTSLGLREKSQRQPAKANGWEAQRFGVWTPLYIKISEHTFILQLSLSDIFPSFKKQLL